MRVKVTKSFKWAADGNNVRLVQEGETLEGRGAVVALELGCAAEAHVELDGKKIAERIEAKQDEAKDPESPDASEPEPAKTSAPKAKRGRRKGRS